MNELFAGDLVSQVRGLREQRFCPGNRSLDDGRRLARLDVLPCTGTHRQPGEGVFRAQPDALAHQVEQAAANATEFGFTGEAKRGVEDDPAVGWPFAGERGRVREGRADRGTLRHRLCACWAAVRARP